MFDGRPPSNPAELERLHALIDRWAERQLVETEAVVAVERGEPGQRRWYVRLAGEEKDTFTVWLTLDQRSLHYETYVMPAPEENHAAFYEHLLRRNRKLLGATFAIGEEDAVFLAGHCANDTLDETELDRILGTLYAATELCFRPALRIGFASRFRGA